MVACRNNEFHHGEDISDINSFFISYSYSCKDNKKDLIYVLIVVQKT